MNRSKNDTFLTRYLTTTPKRRSSSLDGRRQIAVASSPSSPATFCPDINSELPETAQLARAKHFLMTENPKGKVLACGEEVDVMPQNSRFIIRIFNRDFNSGIVKDYVVLTIEQFNEILCHKSEIEKKINVYRCRQTICELDGLKVTVGPPDYDKNGRPTVEIEKMLGKSSVKSPMYIETFTKMMSYSAAVNEEYSRFNARRAEDTRVYEEISNVLAYVRNDHRPNGVIWQPNLGKRGGILTTVGKLVEQTKAILPKEE